MQNTTNLATISTAAKAVTDIPVDRRSLIVNFFRTIAIAFAGQQTIYLVGQATGLTNGNIAFGLKCTQLICQEDCDNLYGGNYTVNACHFDSSMQWECEWYASQMAAVYGCNSVCGPAARSRWRATCP